MRYNPAIPKPRGYRPNEVMKAMTAPVAPTIDPNINGFVFHSLISRVTYDDQVTEEYRPVLNIDVIDLDIDQDKLDALTSKITFGPKINQWKWWLFGYDQYLNTFNDVVFNSINPYSNASDLGSNIDPWNYLYVDGIAAGGNVDVAGILHVSNITQSTSPSNGAILVDGGIGVGKNISIGGNGTIVGTFTSVNTIESVNTTTGAIITSGGIGVNKTAHIGGELFVHDLEYNSNLSLRPVSYNPTTGNISYGADTTLVLTATSNYTIPSNISNPSVLFCTLSTQNIIIDMSSMPDGYILNVKKLDDTVHLVRFNVTIDGDNNPSIKAQYESLAILKKSGSYYLI